MRGCEGVEKGRVAATARRLVTVLTSNVPPNLTLPLPPSDNRRLIPTRQGRLVLSKAAKKYLDTFRPIFRQSAPKTGHVILVYKAYFPSKRRDGGNCMKILKDTLYAEDKNVLGWELPAGKDKQNPRIEVWFITLESE